MIVLFSLYERWSNKFVKDWINILSLLNGKTVCLKSCVVYLKQVRLKNNNNIIKMNITVALIYLKTDLGGGAQMKPH